MKRSPVVSLIPLSPRPDETEGDGQNLKDVHPAATDRLEARGGIDDDRRNSDSCARSGNGDDQCSRPG